MKLGNLASLLLTLQQVHSLTDATMLDLLDTVHILCPGTTGLPSLAVLKTRIKTISLLTASRYQQCRRSCPVQKYIKTSVNCNVGHKRLRESVYVFDIVPQIQSILGNYSWAEMESKDIGPDPTNIIYSLFGSTRYRMKMTSDGQHQVIPYINGTDGVTVNTKKFNRNHQMWPFFLELLFAPFPHKVALLGIICGPKHPKNPTSAFEPMKQKLTELDTVPFIITDRLGVSRSCVGRCILQVCDGPGHAKILGVVHSSSRHACRFCDHKFDTFGGRIVQHDPRCMLPIGDPLRSDPRWAEVNNERHPSRKTNDNHFDLWATAAATINNQLPFRTQLTHINGVKYPALHKDLQEWDIMYDAPLDIMHLVRNLINHLFALFNCSKPTIVPKFDTPKQTAEETEFEYKERITSAQQEFVHSDGYRLVMDAIEQETKFALTQAMKDEIDRRYESVRTHKGLKGTGCPFARSGAMTVANWYFFVKYCSPWIFEDILHGDIYVAVYELFRVFRHFLKHQHRIEWIDEYELEILRTLCEVSLILPLTHQSLWFHYTFHVMGCVKVWGPCYHYSMMRFERHVGTLANDSKLRSSPEANLVERWLIAHRSHPSLSHWNNELRLMVQHLRPRLYKSLFHVDTVSSGRRMGDRHSRLYTSVDGKRKFRVSAYDQYEIMTYISRHAGVFDLDNLNLTRDSIFDNTTVNGEYRYANIDGRILGCMHNESNTEGAVQASCFMSVPNLHVKYTHLHSDMALIGQVRRFIQASVRNPTNNLCVQLEIAEVLMYKWHRDEQPNEQRPYRIDTRRGTYDIDFLPLELLSNTVILIQDTRATSDEMFMIEYDGGRLEEIN